MTELINIQYDVLIMSLVLGGLMGLSYDVVRCLRRLVAHNLLFVSLEDFVYWFVWTIIIIDSIVRYNYGELRLYIFVFLIAGFVVYRTTIGWVIMRLFNYIWCFIKNCLHNANKSLKKTGNDSKI